MLHRKAERRSADNPVTWITSTKNAVSRQLIRTGLDLLKNKIWKETGRANSEYYEEAFRRIAWQQYRKGKIKIALKTLFVELFSWTKFFKVLRTIIELFEII